MNRRAANVDARLSAGLDQLATAEVSTLRRRWAVVMGRPVPAHLPRWLLVRILAYRLQADRFGDLDRDTVRKLDRLAEGEPIPLPDLRIAKPGTLLVREWEGQLHRVMVMETGFAWNGRTFDSLSSAAKAITGTKWNGPRFFGLRSRRDAGRGASA